MFCAPQYSSVDLQQYSYFVIQEPVSETELEVPIYTHGYEENGVLYCASSTSADECAEILAKEGLLPNDVGPKTGFNFRQMLRDGRDGYIALVEGAFQERPNTRWHIFRKDD